MSIESIKHGLDEISTEMTNMYSVIARYRKALKEIRQEAIHNSDSVEAATKMGIIAIEALEGKE